MQIFSEIAPGVDGIYVENTRFNTTLVSFNFFVPLSEDTVADNAVLPYVISSCSYDYRDYSKLNFKLDMLYGADLNIGVDKVGDMQRIKLAISVINDEYAFEPQTLIDDAVELLLSLVFRPAVENKCFFADDVEREKRKMKEHIIGEINDKRVFAKNRMLSLMFKDMPYGMSKYGTAEKVEGITGTSLYEAWQRLITDSYVRVQVIGKKLPDGLFSRVAEKFSAHRSIQRKVYPTAAPAPTADSVNEVTEYYDVSQGKLVMGFSSEVYGNDAYSLSVMTDIFGGGPYSALFENVREKMSLCYYCSASSVRNKGLLIVDSGVEVENAEKAVSEIVNQLELIKAGKFSKFIFEASKKSMCSSLKSYNDSIGALDGWYSTSVFEKTPKSPEEVSDIISSVTIEDVISSANGIKLHTVYKLLPAKEDK